MRPKRTDDKYWIGTRNFNHIQYESDLEDYIIDLENENHQLRKHDVVSRLSDRVDEIANKTDANINRTLFRIVGNHIEVYEIDLSEEKVKSFLGSFKINDL
jgi:hypothetical protein